MTRNLHEEARRALLPDLPAGHEQALCHLLTCEPCRREIAERLKASLDAPRDECLPLAGPPLTDRDAELLIRETLSQGRQARDRLATLEALPPPEQLLRLQEPRFLSADLLLLLLERAREAGPGSPEACLGFCQLASALTGHLLGRLFDEEEAALWHAQAECLRGNAERVRGDFEAARAAFGRAAAWLALTPGRTLEGAELCRGRGLLLWEQGRLDEAEGLLRQSSRILAEAGPPDEEGAARVLLGLLAAERGDRGRAARLLEAGRAALDPERWPWLALHARLGLALEYARRGQARRAEALLDPQPVEEEGPDTGLLRAWLEGQVRLRIGQPAEGEKRLREAWCGFLARDDGPRAALCALDLAAALVRQGRGGEVGTLVDTLRAGCRGDPALEAFCAGSRNAMTAGELDRLTREEGLSEAVARARRVLRSRGYGVLLAV